MHASFSQLDKRVQSIISELKFEPTDIQVKAVPEILSGSSVLLIAPTGTGKTEAALFPLFNKLLEKEHEPISVLYITPLRALNRDMLARIEKFGEKLGISVAVRHGDTPQSQRAKQLKNPPQVLVTTPETLNILLVAPKMKENLKNVRYVVIDEVHELVESKRGVQLSVALKRLEITAGHFQRIGLSATIGNPVKTAAFFELSKIITAEQDRKLYLKVEYPKYDSEDVKVSVRLHTIPEVIARIRLLHELMNEHESVLTFVNTRATSEILSSRFEAWAGSQKIGVHHSSLSKDTRVIAEKKFKEGELKGLICTSSLELGIDIGSIDLVVQYASPRQVQRIIQRVGRSGHSIHKFPKGVIIALDEEDLLEAGVITDLAYLRKLEEPKDYKKPLDVLAHQLVGLSINHSPVKILNAYEFMKKVPSYKDLTMEEIVSVLTQLADERLIWLDEEEFGKRKEARMYYYSGVSTIPDEARFFVKDASSNANIAVLDESFVANNLRPGSLFITKGKPWRVLDITDKEVIVEPSFDISGAIPAWEGEQIPVSFEVAQRVGAVRKKHNFKDLMIDKNGLAALEKLYSEQLKYFIPDDKTVVVEEKDNFTVLHACFGSKVNETIARVLSILISTECAESIAVKVSPYSIIFEFADASRTDLVRKYLFETKPESIEFVLQKAMLRTQLFKSKFIHVAKRFGLISRESGYANSRVSIRRVVQAVVDSPVYQETLNEIFAEKFDVQKAMEIMHLIQGRKIKFEEYSGKTSPLTEITLAKVMRLPELILPQRPESEIIELMMQRTDEKLAKLICTYCRNINYSYVKDLPEKIKCPVCGSTQVTFSKGRDGIVFLLAKKMSNREMNENEVKKIQEYEQIASLVSAYGKKAVIVLSGVGIGPDKATQILGRMRRTEKEVFKDMLEAQKDFLRTKQYWK